MNDKRILILFDTYRTLRTLKTDLLKYGFRRYMDVRSSGNRLTIGATDYYLVLFPDTAHGARGIKMDEVWCIGTDPHMGPFARALAAYHEASVIVSPRLMSADEPLEMREVYRGGGSTVDSTSSQHLERDPIGESPAGQEVGFPPDEDDR